MTGSTKTYLAILGKGKTNEQYDRY